MAPGLEVLFGPPTDRQASMAGSNKAPKFLPKAPAAPTPARSPNGVSTQEEVPLRTSNVSVGAVVRWAVKCLYQEEALPRGPLLQWLLLGLLGVKLSHKELREIIEADPQMRLDPPDSRKLNFNAVLEDKPCDFTGFVTDAQVIEELTPELWEEVAICLAEGGWPVAEDAAHKFYVVASHLQDVSEKFHGWSLGRMLAIVRFAAQSDCMLGHRGGLLVPYEHSEECERRVNAETGLPTHIKDGESYVRTWEELQECLHWLLQENQVDMLEVSKMKLMFRSELGMELSETVFGHQCLSRLLADERLGEDFVLETCQGNRYVVRLLPEAKYRRAAAGMESRRAARSSDKDGPAGTAPFTTKKANRRPTARKQESRAEVRPPPGLSLPGANNSPTPPPGLAEDPSVWPALGDDSKSNSPTVSLSVVGPPPGLTPEKHEKPNRKVGLSESAQRALRKCGVGDSPTNARPKYYNAI